MELWDQAFRRIGKLPHGTGKEVSRWSVSGKPMIEALLSEKISRDFATLVELNIPQDDLRPLYGNPGPAVCGGALSPVPGK
jgi:hypothetical protein